MLIRFRYSENVIDHVIDYKIEHQRCLLNQIFQVLPESLQLLGRPCSVRLRGCRGGYHHNHNTIRYIRRSCTVHLRGCRGGYHHNHNTIRYTRRPCPVHLRGCRGGYHHYNNTIRYTRRSCSVHLRGCRGGYHYYYNAIRYNMWLWGSRVLQIELKSIHLSSLSPFIYQPVSKLLLIHIWSLSPGSWLVFKLNFECSLKFVFLERESRNSLKQLCIFSVLLRWVNANKVWTNAIKVWANAIKVWPKAIKISDQHKNVAKLI